MRAARPDTNSYASELSMHAGLSSPMIHEAAIFVETRAACHPGRERMIVGLMVACALRICEAACCKASSLGRCLMRQRIGFRRELLLFCVPLLLTSACAYNGSVQIMGAQPNERPFAEEAARQPVPDTVARGQLQDDQTLYTGLSGGQPAAAFPYTITSAILQRGQERYDIFCAPCHSRTGDGDGIIVQRGFPHAASLQSPRLRDAPVGQVFGVITNGFGAMPAYAAQIPVRDRWAIIAYIRALQLSEHATINDVPPADRDKVDAGKP